MKIIDVKVLTGDSSFLLDDGKVSILVDSGFGFTGEEMTNKIADYLGDRKLDYIFLTHSHYDHVLGSINAALRYPEAKVVAGAYASKIFAKPTARALMHKLDSEFAKECGYGDYADLTEHLKVDIEVEDGDTIKTGDLTWQVIGLPGHTKCSVGYYCVEEKLLIGVESLGVYGKNGIVMPSYLVGYQMVMDSIARVKALNPEKILIPHYGVIEGEEAKVYLMASEKSSVEDAKMIKRAILEGKTDEEIVSMLHEKYYFGYIETIYPIAAFTLNAGITVRLLRNEEIEF